jgi:eukaryotic-like serine/threonine-protein kinase
MSTGSEDSTDTLPTTDEALDSLMHKAARALDPVTGPPLPHLGTLVADKYVLEAQLGRGGMGAVYRARHQLTGKQFAMKWLLPDLTERPDAVQRFMREARVGGKFEHSNVVEVYDVGRHDNCHYIVMELVQGETLASRLQRSGALTVRDTCRLLIPVMRGVYAAHRAGVIHRDLKPHNIIISRDEMGDELPKVVDFGISKVLPQAEQTHSTETAEGTIIGTPEYMAPEQLRRQAMDARVDVYAMGVIAYQLLSGTLPFTADNRTDLICKILAEPVTPLQSLAAAVPSAIADAVAQAMAKDPAARFQSLAAFARALEPFAGGMRFAPTSGLDDTAAAPFDAAAPVQQPTPFGSEAAALPTTGRRRVLPLLAATAAAAGLVLGLAAYLAVGTPAPQQPAAPLQAAARPASADPSAADPSAAAAAAGPGAAEPAAAKPEAADPAAAKPAAAPSPEPTVPAPIPVQPTAAGAPARTATTETVSPTSAIEQPKQKPPTILKKKPAVVAPPTSEVLAPDPHVRPKPPRVHKADFGE